jgi:hypothetical protein
MFLTMKSLLSKIFLSLALFAALVPAIAPADSCLLVLLGLRCRNSGVEHCSCCGKELADHESKCPCGNDPFSSDHKNCCVYSPAHILGQQSQHPAPIDTFQHVRLVELAAELMNALLAHAPEQVLTNTSPHVRTSDPPLFLRDQSFLI